MKDNTQIAHTKFQKYTTSQIGVIAKRKKKQQELMFVLFLKETRHFYIKKLFSYQFICSKSTLWG